MAWPLASDLFSYIIVEWDNIIKMLYLIPVKANPPSALIFLLELFILVTLMQPLWGTQVFSVRYFLDLIVCPTCGGDIHPTLLIIQEEHSIGPWCLRMLTVTLHTFKHTHIKQCSQNILRNAGSNEATGLSFFFFLAGLLREFNMLMCTMSLHQ